MQDGNPYQAPAADVPVSLGDHGGGRFTLAQAWNEAVETTRSHVGEWLLGGLVIVLLYTVLLLTVLGIFLGLPVLVWGVVYWALRMLRNQRSRVSDIFEGFRRYGQVLGPSLLLIVLTVALTLPGVVVQAMLAFTGVDALAALGALFNNVWSLVVTVRFAFAWFYLVDRQLSAAEALRASWEATGPQWLSVLVLMLLAIPLSLIGLLALVVGLIVTTVLWGFMLVSAYRQTAGDPIGPESSAVAKPHV